VDRAALPRYVAPVTSSLDAKRDQVIARLRSLGSVLVAYSGGVDSALLLALAIDALGERAVAFTALSAAVPPDEASAELEDPRYAANPVNRCYFCKTELYTLATAEARALGLAAVVSGTNADELADYRPGLQAASEHEVVQPLAEAALTKAEIRELSRDLKLPTWDKPQQPCLSSRIPYGTEVTPERLAQLAESEMALRKLGLREFRVRYHGEIARIEAGEADFDRLVRVRADALAALKAAGFKFVTIDLEPFRSGRLNEAAGLVPLRR